VVQHEVDSEATESSSGGESCDEMQNYNNPHQQYLSM
jgi:KAT8 regulatory NSL complex subunit 1